MKFVNPTRKKEKSQNTSKKIENWDINSDPTVIKAF